MTTSVTTWCPVVIENGYGWYNPRSRISSTFGGKFAELFSAPVQLSFYGKEDGR